jgi:hypothetical protein
VTAHAAYIPIGTFSWWNYGWEYELEYYSFYRAGEGPYYEDDNSGNPIYSTLDSNMHYEEYGISIDNWGVAYLDLALGSNTAYAPWIGRLEFNLDAFKIRPYR